MSKISEIDSRLKVESSIHQEGLRWINANSPCFSLFGLLVSEEGYKRMDSDVARQTNDGVYYLHRNTSGGRLIFETDSPFMAISMKAAVPTRFPHMPLTGTSGFDLYQDCGNGFEYWRTFVPPYDFNGQYESLVPLPTDGMRKIMIHFPLYNDVDELYIGLDENAEINPYNPYRDLKPILYYGSSITQGGCASRPGCNYPAIVSMKTGIDFVCLGFSGSAHGEKIMAEYIAKQPMSVFVMDYDHNDCCNGTLKDKHEDFYRIVREQNPDLPIIIMSAPYSAFDLKDLKDSRNVVYNTYQKAKANGDNVYFIEGMEMFKDFREFATVDHSHPNDYGFVTMAQAVMEVLEKIDLS